MNQFKQYVAVVTIGALMAWLPCDQAIAGIQDSFRRWTYQIEDYGYFAKLTYVSNDLLDEWYSGETSPEARKRIDTLRNTVAEGGVSVYLIHFEGRGTSSWTLSPVRQNSYVQIVEQSPQKYSPVAYSGNLDDGMSGKNDFYGVLVFKLPPEEFSHQVVTLTVTRTRLRGGLCGPNSRPQDWNCAPETRPLQFAFKPDGVATKNRGSTGNTVDIISMLKLALQIALKFRV